MDAMLSEVVIVLILIALNGFFSATEMAIISLRKTRVKQLVKEGNSRAVLIEKILKKPEEFLATIQVGMTLISTIASAYAGASLSDDLSPILSLSGIPWIANHAEFLALVLIVLSITYLSVVVGELIPKSLGIKFAEKVAMIVVYPIYLLSKITYPLTQILTFSSNLVLRIFGDNTSFSEANLTEEELRTLLYESHKAGTIEKYEHEILDNIFDFSDIAVGQIMTPRPKIFSIDVADPFEDNKKAIIESSYSRIPVVKDRIDNVIGVMYLRDFMTQLLENRQLDSFETLINKPFFVPNTQRISDLLKKLQKEKTHMALVTDEYGDIVGLVTIEDILEEIVGEISDETDEEDKQIFKLKDGSYKVDGSVSIVDFNRQLKAHFPEDEQYTTISGLLLEAFETIPNVGTKTTIKNFEFTVTEKTERMIQFVNVRRVTE